MCTEHLQYWRGGKKAYPEPMVSPQYGPGAGVWGPIDNCEAVDNGPFGWATSYISYAIGAAAQRLYDNDGGILQRYGEFWAMMAQRFKDNPGVLGYELLNEVRPFVLSCTHVHTGGTRTSQSQPRRPDPYALLPTRCVPCHHRSHGSAMCGTTWICSSPARATS